MEIHIAVKRGSFGDTWQVDIKGKCRSEDLSKLTEQLNASTRSKSDTFFVCETEKPIFEEWLLDILSYADFNIGVLAIKTTQIFGSGCQNRGTDDMKNKASMDKLIIAMENAEDSIPKHILDIVVNNRHIRSIEVECHSGDDWNVLASAIQNNTSILSCSVLPNKKLQAKPAFFEALAKNQTLKQLRIKSIPMSAADMKRLNNALAINTTLEELELENWSGDESTSLIPSKTLKSLKYTLGVPAKESDIFYEALSRNKSLTRLDLRGCGPNFVPLGKYVKDNQVLKVLALAPYKADAMKSLAPILKNHPSITDLTMPSIELNSTIDFITNALNINKSITKLTITGHMNPETVSAVCQSLYQNDTLTRLTLDAEGYGERFVLQPKSQFFSKLIAKNKALKYLSVKGMPTTDLYKILVMNSGLISLHSGHTTASSNVHHKQIETALKSNNKLLSFTIEEHIMIKKPAPPPFAFVGWYIERNRNLYIDAALVVHNILRSDMIQWLPLEIWTCIFNVVGHPYSEHWHQTFNKK